MKKRFVSNIIRICAIVSLGLSRVVWGATGEFDPVDPNRIQEILTLIADGIRSNYDGIKTWQGKVEVLEDHIYREARAEKEFKEKTDGNGEIPKTLKRHRQWIIQFFLDSDKELLYSHYYPDSVRPLQYTDLQSGRDLGAKGIPNNRSAILTPEYELHCTGDRMQSNVVISRKAVKETRRKDDCPSCSSNLPPVYDPRASFSPIKNYIPDFFTRMVKHINNDGRYRIDGYDLVVEENKSGDICDYRVTIPSKRRLDSQEYLFSTLVFRKDKGFNITSYQETVLDPVHNGITLQKRTWDYDLVDGVYVPSRMTRQEFDWPNGELSLERTKTFKNQKVNKVIPEETFTYNNLGLQTGDKFIDKIRSKEYVYQNNMLVEVEATDE